MIDLTIQNVIKALPFDEQTKQELVKNLDTYPEEKQLAISKVCWDAFGQLEDLLEAYWQERVIQEISEGKRKPVADLEAEVDKEKWNDIEERISGKKQEEQELSHIRSQLEKLIKTE